MDNQPAIKYPALKCEKQTGTERITKSDGETLGSLQDYWMWAHSNLNSNAERGKFAEFLVCRALKCDGEPSDEWRSYDIDWEGIKIEVKCSAYVQVWGQKELTRPRFTVCPTKAWKAEDNSYATESCRQADVYVLCLETSKGEDGTCPNPLDLSEWRFYVLPTSTLNALNAPKSISLNQAINYGAREISDIDDLRAAIRDAAAENSLCP